jgi:hypothetical protein
MAMLLSEICCASLPLAGLPALAELRCLAGVRVAVDGERAWLRWPAEEKAIALAVLVIRGAVLYAEREGQWFRLGSRLPAPGWPAHLPSRPLHDVLVPAPVEPAAVSLTPLRPARLGLVRDSHPRETSALRCSLAALAAWADRAPTAQLAAISGIRSGNEAVLRGRGLPPLPCAQRYWGERVLAPLGYRPEPELPETALLAALDAGDEGVAILENEGVELLPLNAFEPLSRSGVRLTLAEPG